jgi:uncharacterized protein YfaP (DUF2135 family)
VRSKVLAELAVLVVLTTPACRARRAVSYPPPPAPAAAVPGGNQLLVTLIWAAPVDLDLYVTDPTWETVYFANTPGRTGGRLTRDTRCSDVAAGAGAFVEVASTASPRAGRYRVGVDYIEACSGAAAPVSYRITVEHGERRREATGTLRLEEFQPIVVEFDLQPTGPGGALVLEQEG